MADGSSQSIRFAPPATRKAFRIADLFCGSGGTSTGIVRAIREILRAQGLDVSDMGQHVRLAALNHWPVAVDTHSRNHPWAAHHCVDLEHAMPRDIVPDGVLDLLCASPTCTFHSRARGGRPVHDQQRMDPWHVVRWCTDLRVHRLMVENVPEFMDWGPCSLVTGRPIPSRRGEYFRAWIAALKSIGFRLEYRVLCCADYGDVTTRERFFMIGCSDGKPLRWPEPSHAKHSGADLFGQRLPWRGTSEIIDWSDLGSSIFTRRRPLVLNTIARLRAGTVRYDWPQPHIDALQALLDGETPRLNLTPAEAQRWLPAESLVMATGSTGAARPTSEPMPTQVTGATPHFVTPLIMGVSSHNAARPTSQPVPTITTGGASASTHPGNARPRLMTPLIAPYYGGGSGLTSISAHAPLPAATTKDRFGLVQPFVMRTDQVGGRTPGFRTLDQPVHAIVTKSNAGLAIPTVTGYRIDILYRMLHWRELARATSFDDEGEVYDFAGTGTEIVKQIGNAVPSRTAKALGMALLRERL